jgi:hypothetical protein
MAEVKDEGQKRYYLPVIDGIRSGPHHPFSTADATPRSIVCCMRDLLASIFPARREARGGL